MINGKDILKTLIELLEAQEEIKVTYVLKEDSNECKSTAWLTPHKAL